MTHLQDIEKLEATLWEAADNLRANSLGIEPGQPFPATPLQVVNSPLEVMVNARSADVLGAAGYPASVDHGSVAG